MANNFSKTKRLAVFSKMEGKCSMCLKSLQIENALKDDYMHIDHLIPKAKGGSNSINNLMPICKCCNSSKKDNNTIDMVLSIEKKIDKMFKHNILNLIQYEKNNGVFEQQVFTEIVSRMMRKCVSGFNELLEVCNGK